MSTTRWFQVTIFSLATAAGFLYSLGSYCPAMGADDSATATAPQNTATAPVVHTGTESRIKRISDRAQQGDVDLLFIGDSITQGWENGGDRGGKAVWHKYYDNRKAMNCGIGGDRTQHVLWRLENGNIEGIHPKLSVIMIGTNNSNNKDNTAEEIGEGITAIVHQVREKLPESKILILGIFPRGATTDEQLKNVVTSNGKKEVNPADVPAKITAEREKTMVQRKKNAEASAIAAKLADNKTIFYMDIGPKFLEADGTLPDDIMPDHLHPNAKGYEIWAAAIEPKIAELLGDKPIENTSNNQ